MLSQDGTLSIQDVSYDKAGEYMCVAAVPSVPGLTAEASVNLTIKGNTLAQTCSLYIHTFRDLHAQATRGHNINKDLMIG